MRAPGGLRCPGQPPPDAGPFGDRLALTFEGGDGQALAQTLAVLERHGAPATFFLEAGLLDGSPEVIKTIRREPGFDVGSAATGESRAATAGAIERESKALLRHELDPTFFRFRGTERGCESVAYVREAGYAIAGWHIDAGSPGEVETLRAQVAALEGGVVRFADLAAWTPAALDALLSALELDGVRFVALTDRGVFPEQADLLAARRARRLGLGGRDAAHRLIEGRVEPRWVVAAGGRVVPETLQWPVDNAFVARGYGSGEGGYHLAVDVAYRRGSPVRSVASGIVGYAGSQMPGYGNIAFVVHHGGLVSFYAHNDELLVRAGQLVERGEVIARLGTTGLARGPHVHFELAWNELTCDPAPLFRPVPVSRRGPIAGLLPRIWREGEPPPVRCGARRLHPHTRWARPR